MIHGSLEDDDHGIVETSQNPQTYSPCPYRIIIQIPTSRTLSSLPISRRTLTVGKVRDHRHHDPVSVWPKHWGTWRDDRRLDCGHLPYHVRRPRHGGDRIRNSHKRR